MIGRRFLTVIVVALVVVPSALMYTDRLAWAPPHVQIDEAMIAVNAQAIATTGRDLWGDTLPLYTQTAAHSWYQPVVIYAGAAALSVLPFNEWSIRAPTVTLALINVALMMLLVREWFGSLVLAIVAGLLLALSPGHFIHARYGMDYLYPVTFILAWLVCLATFRNGRGRGWLVGGGAALGVGFYCYISSIVMMPFYAGLTLLLLWRGRAKPADAWRFLAAFAACVVPFAYWLLGHLDAYAATVDKYGLYDTGQVGAAQGLSSMFSFLSVAQRVSLYWDYFDPALLFFGSGIKVQFSTGLAGVFLLPVAAFIIAGIYAALQRGADAMERLVLAGFFTAPLAAVIPTEPNAIFRALGILPFGILLAVIGVRQLWRLPADRWLLARRMFVAAVLLAVPLQFSSFWSDYFTSYRERSAIWLGGNIGGALEEVIAEMPPNGGPDLYFSPLSAASGQLDWRNGFLDTYWRFYLVKQGRLDLLERAHRLEAPEAVSRVPPGSLVLSNTESPSATLLAGMGAQRLREIPELDGRPFFWIWRR